MEGTPGHEGPGGTMPQTWEEEHNPEVEVSASLAFTVATERNIKIVHHPAAEGDVPAFPELRHALADIRVVEVFGELEAYHAPDADGHVTVAWEVEIDLHGVGKDAQPSSWEADFCGGQGKHLVDIFCQDVGNQHLLW